MTSHNVLVCSNSSTQWLTSNLLILIRKLKLFIHGWSITSCFETCQLRTILKLNVSFLVDFITWNYKNTSIKRILMRLNRLYYHNTCWSWLQLRFGMYQSIAMTSHNVLVCSNSSTQWLTSNLLILIRKLKLFIHGWSITSCFETCQLRTILKLNVPFLVVS